MSGGARRQEYGGTAAGYTPPSLFPQQSSQPEQLQMAPSRAAPIFHPQQRNNESTAYKPPVVEDRGLFDRLSKPKPAAQLSSSPDLLFLDKPPSSTLDKPPTSTSLDLISFDPAPSSHSKDLLSLEVASPTPTPPQRPSPAKITHNMAPAPQYIPNPVQVSPSKGLSLEALAAGLDDLKLEPKPKDSKSDFIIRI